MYVLLKRIKSDAINNLILLSASEDTPKSSSSGIQ